MVLEQYCLYEFDLSKNIGTCEPDIVYSVVISPNEMNEALQTVIVAPLCNDCAVTPTTFLIDDITRVKLDQLTSISKDKAIRYIDKLSIHQVKKIKKVLDEMLIK